MGVSDFGQVSRLVWKRFQKRIRPPKAGKHRLKVAGSLLRMDFKSEARTEIMRAVRKERVL